MKKDLYLVEIPAILTSMVGKQNIRENIEEATQAIFAVWANPTLVGKIKVTKPRAKREKGDQEDE